MIIILIQAVKIIFKFHLLKSSATLLSWHVMAIQFIFFHKVLLQSWIKGEEGDTKH